MHATCLRVTGTIASFTGCTRLEMGRCIMGSRQARTVERGYFREALQKPRQQATALKLPDMGHVWIMCLDYLSFVKHTPLRLSIWIRRQAVHRTLATPDFMWEKNKAWSNVFALVFDLRARTAVYMLCLIQWCCNFFLNNVEIAPCSKDLFLSTFESFAESLDICILLHK